MSAYVLPSLDEAARRLACKCGIYHIEHIPSGRSYIGQSIDAGGRLIQHVKALNRGNHSSPELQREWTLSTDSDEWGADLLEECTEAALDSREQHWIKQHPDCFNAKCSKRSRGLVKSAKIRSNKPDVRPIYPSAEARAILDRLAGYEGLTADEFANQLILAAGRAAGELARPTFTLGNFEPETT